MRKLEALLTIILISLIAGAIFFIHDSGYKLGYEEGYEAAKEEIETYEVHSENCDGHCDHVEEEIEDRIYDDELIYRDDIFYEEDVYDEDDMNDSYWEGAYDGYIEGYGDRHYGNKRELDLDEYENKNLFDW